MHRVRANSIPMLIHTPYARSASLLYFLIDFPDISVEMAGVSALVCVRTHTYPAQHFALHFDANMANRIPFIA